MTVDLGSLNDRLASAYGSKLPMTFPLLGGQGFGLFHHFLLGGSGAALLGRSVDLPNNREASLNGAWGTVDFGYQLVRVNGFLLAPILSAGGYGMTMTVDSKLGGSFDDVLANPARGTALTNKGAIGGVAVLAKWIVLGRQAGEADARAGLAIGLRLGALYGIPVRRWQADGTSVGGGPTLGLRGAYAALSLGTGSW